MNNIELIREYIGYLVSMAAMYDSYDAKYYADKLEELLPKVENK